MSGCGVHVDSAYNLRRVSGGSLQRVRSRGVWISVLVSVLVVRVSMRVSVTPDSRMKALKSLDDGEMQGTLRSSDHVRLYRRLRHACLLPLQLSEKSASAMNCQSGKLLSKMSQLSALKCSCSTSPR